jgi:hypothetical protein
LAVIRLRWYVVAVVVLVAAVGGLHVKQTKPLYLGTSVVVLTPPKEATVPNKLAAVTPSIAVVGLAVNMSLLDKSQADRLRRDGVVGDFTITPRNSGTDETPQYLLPSELISVETGDPAVALRSVTTLQRLFAEQLDTWQADQGLAPVSRITAQVLVAPGVQPVLGAHSRGLIGTALLAAGASVVAPLWFDRYVRWRERRGRRPLIRWPNPRLIRWPNPRRSARYPSAT